MEYKTEEEIKIAGYLDLHEYIVEGLTHLLTSDLRIISNLVNELLEDTDRLMKPNEEN